MNIDEARELIKAEPKWLKEFQKYCDSDEIQEESELNGINACGYGVQCDECIFEEKYQCAKAMQRYMLNKRVTIDYANTSKEYFRSLLNEKFEVIQND